MPRWEYGSVGRFVLGSLVDLLIIVASGVALVQILLYALVAIVVALPGDPSTGQGMYLVTIAIGSYIWVPALYLVAFLSSPLPATPGKLIIGSRIDGGEGPVLTAEVVLHLVSLTLFCFMVLSLLIAPAAILFGIGGAYAWWKKSFYAGAR